MSKKKPGRNSIFNSVVREKVSQHLFNLGYHNRTTMHAGYLYPVFLKPTVPGDVWYGRSGAFLRTQPMVNPVFFNSFMEMRYFWVPYRSIWKNWVNYRTDSYPTSQYTASGKGKFNGVHPYFETRYEYEQRTGHTALRTSWENATCEGSLMDFLGFPSMFGRNLWAVYDHVPGLDELRRYNGSSLDFRAYLLIWNEYFRDENLMNPVPFNLNDSPDSLIDLIGGEHEGKINMSHFGLMPVCWKKDRLTSALPWTQKGEDMSMEAIVQLLNQDNVQLVEDPLGDYLVDKNHPKFGYYYLDGDTGEIKWQNAGGLGEDGTVGEGAALQAVNILRSQDHNVEGIYVNQAAGDGFDPVARPSAGKRTFFDPNGSLGVELSIRRLRQAAAIQRILEKKALAGSRYSEYILSFFGVRIPDPELNRPLYLGGGKNPLNVSPVEQNSSTDGTSPQGNLAGKGVLAGSFGFNRPWLFNDYGVVMGLAYIRPEADYFNRLDRTHIYPASAEDYYNPDYQLLGEEEIMNQEVAYNYFGVNEVNGVEVPVDPTYDNVGDFGYNSRYSWLKSSLNEIHGKFTDDMISWVQPRRITRGHALNLGFVRCNPYEADNFAVEGYDHYLIDFYHDFYARRPLYFLPRMINGQL